jgi:hypothetical protein
VSEELTPEHPPARRSWLPFVAGLVVALSVVAVVIILNTGSRATHAPRPRPSSAAAVGSGAAPAGNGGDRVRVSDIAALLARRARAILGHDPAALLSTIDPTRPAFAASQVRMLAHLKRVPLASWSYTLTGSQTSTRAVTTTASGVPTYSPTVGLHYQLRGFDADATDLRQYPTFTRRHGRWYLASLGHTADSGRDRGAVSATDLWDYGPVDVVRRPHVLVLGPPSMLGTMGEVADGLAAAIPRVSAVWGPRWPRRVVAEVPATQRELGEITGDTGDLSSFAALSSAEVSSAAGHPAPVGDRVSINPRTWSSLDALGRRVVLTHELTHVATRADTGTETPRWLQEGFADYVGFLGTAVPTTVVARELATDVRAGRVPARLPTNHQFAGSSPDLAQAYQQGWLACRLIATRAGQATLVRFYREVGTATTPGEVSVSRALHRLLGLSTARFTALWRASLRAQLG